MIGVVAGIEAGGTAELTAAPPAGGLLPELTALAGSLPALVPGDPAILPQEVGRLTDLSGWQAFGGPIDFSQGLIDFPAALSPRVVGHDLSSVLPTGTRVQVTWRQVGSGTARIRIGQDVVSPWRERPGWHAEEVVLTAPGTRLNIDGATAGPGVGITEIAIRTLPDLPAHDIVLLLGGANMTGQWSGESPDPQIDLPDTRVDVGRGTHVSGGTDPLWHQQRIYGLGPGLWAARRLADGLLEGGRRLLLLPLASTTGRLVPAGATDPAEAAGCGWQPQNDLSGHADLFSTAVGCAQDALARNPGGNRIVGAIWSGGEAEWASGASAAAYAGALGSVMVPALRAALALPELPIAVLGGNPAAMPAGWLQAEAALDAESAAPQAVAGLRHVPWQAAWGDGTKPMPRSPSDAVHFSGSANRLRGVAGGAALAALIGGGPGGAEVGLIAADTVIGAETLILA